MIAQHLRKVVDHGQGIVGLRQVRNGRSDDEGVEGDVLNALDGRRERDNARRARSGDKTLRRQAGANATRRASDVVRRPQETQAQFVYGGGSEGLRVSKVDQLRAAQVQRIESRHAGAPLSGWIGIVQAIVVEIVVSREQAPTLAAIVDTKTALVVPQNFSVST